jgi:hypothetical protein
LAAFDGNTNTIKYTDEVTEYFMKHESFHAEEMKIIGFNEYVKEAALKGTSYPNGYTNENVLTACKTELLVRIKMIEISETKNLTLLSS